MAIKESTEQLYNAIRQEYNKLCGVKEHGVQKYSNAWILKNLATKYFKSSTTIENIIHYRV